MRNKMGGSVFSKNRAGNYARTKVTPANPKTVSQQGTRSILGGNSQAWRGLTEAQRQSWLNAVALFPVTDVFGNTNILSGSGLYTKLNNNLLSVGAAAISSAPSPVAIPAITALTLTATQTGTPALSLVFAPTPVPAGFRLVVEATPPVSPGKYYVENLFRRISTVAPAGTSPANILAAFNTKYGAMTVGSKVYVRAFYISLTTGQAGVPFKAVATVA